MKRLMMLSEILSIILSILAIAIACFNLGFMVSNKPLNQSNTKSDVLKCKICGYEMEVNTFKFNFENDYLQVLSASNEILHIEKVLHTDDGNLVPFEYKWADAWSLFVGQ